DSKSRYRIYLDKMFGILTAPFVTTDSVLLTTSLGGYTEVGGGGQRQRNDAYFGFGRGLDSRNEEPLKVVGFCTFCKMSLLTL
ncbi:hypothetical protein CHS0354_033765, partial [Potamilus streckersoni]